MFSKKRALTGWTIALINLCAITNIKNFPLLAEYGLSIITFLALSAVFFFLPTAFVSAELASAWPERGVYTWVRTAFGPKMGFLAVWFQWISNVIYYPTLLSFIASTFAYIFDPSLAQNKVYVMTVVLVTFWLATFVNLRGMHVSGLISSITALFGTIIPIALIILLGAGWFFGGHPLQVTFSWGAIFPNLKSINELVLLSGVISGLCGMEMSAVHAKDVQHPRRDYPRGIFFSALLILAFSILGSLAISMVVPASEIQLAAGGMEAFVPLFRMYGISWVMPLVAGLTTFGALGMLSTWIAGPSRSLLASAEDGDIHPLFRKTNKHGMPTSILIAQASIVTIISLAFLFMPSVNSSYLAFLVLSSMLYMLTYVLMFFSAIRLHYKQPDVPRAYKIPFGRLGIWTISVLGLIGSAFSFFIGFFSPSHIDTGSALTFKSLLVGCVLLFCLLPTFIYRNKRA